MSKLLLIVDAQHDFMEGGKLSVNGAMAKMNRLANYIKDTDEEYTDIVMTADFHPYFHSSFINNGGEWPPHCINYTCGAAIHEDILRNSFEKGVDSVQILTKGNKENKDEYSIFQNEENGLKLREFIAEKNFDEIHVCGICGDICVKNTINGLIELLWGDKVVVLKDFTPSLDGGKILNDFCEKNNIKMI